MGKESKCTAVSDSIPWFWERDNLYRIGDQCCYATVCRKASNGKCDQDPETCKTWDAMYDGECQADEVLSE